MVEVLAACAILGIALAPILSSFVSVARVNTTSRKKLAATTVGESVMEAVKAFELKDVAYQCDILQTDKNQFKLLAGDLESGTPFSGSAAELTKSGGSYTVASPSYELNGGKVVFKQSSNRCYAFIIMDIPMGGTTYDAIINYTYVPSKSETTFQDDEGNDVLVEDTLSSMSVRTLRYYEITIEVWKSEGGSAAERLSFYGTKGPLCILSGTKADYN